MLGIHLRYLGEDLRVVEGVGVFQQGTVAFVPRHLARRLVASGEFEPVTSGPLAKVIVLRIGQDVLPSDDVARPAHLERETPIDFEQELEDEERRLEAAAAAAPAGDDGAAKQP